MWRRTARVTVAHRNDPWPCPGLRGWLTLTLFLVNSKFCLSKTKLPSIAQHTLSQEENVLRYLENTRVSEFTTIVNGTDTHALSLLVKYFNSANNFASSSAITVCDVSFRYGMSKVTKVNRLLSKYMFESCQ